VRGPGASAYSDEVASSAQALDIIETLAEVGVKFKLGHLTDQEKRDLTPEQATLLVKRRIDILRILLAKEMVAEAEQIRRQWAIPGRRSHATGRRYGDLLFSARAILPPGVDWDDVTYTDYENRRVCWSHQLAFDKDGRMLEGVAYSGAEGEQLLEEFKGAERGEDVA
jgi:hypothetical protein